MLATDEDALVCDFAETYHVLDWRALPLRTAATLASGLSPDSRILRKLTGIRAPLADILRAATVDRLSLLLWTQTKDGHKNRNRPESLVERLLNPKQEQGGETESFASPEAFEAAWKRAIKQ